MKTHIHLFLTATIFAGLDFDFSDAHAQGTAFTYQGRLNDTGAPANGNYDFRFKLYSDPLGNTQIGSSYLTNGIPVTNGLFATTIDFGAGVFNGSNCWLEVDVRTNGVGGYADLMPLQAVTPTPYAIFADNASNVLGIVSAAQISGAVLSANFSGAYGNAVTLNNANNNFSGNYSGNGGGLTNLNAWGLSGNSGMTPGVNYIGTADNQPLEMRVDNVRILRLEPDTRGPGDGGNIVGGFSGNEILQPGSGGDIIAGGGYPGIPNIISSNSSGVFIGGGSINQAGPGNNIVIDGGIGNTAQEQETTIGGGEGNTIQWEADHATIAGGLDNWIQTNSWGSAIGGGSGNIIEPNADHATIAGGFNDSIQTNAWDSFIGGGYGNVIAPFAEFAVIGGGNYNFIGTNDGYVFIGGGGGNSIGMDSLYAVLGGGNLNFIGPDSPSSVLVGGYGNSITNVGGAFIGGGGNNSIQTNAEDSFIGGGYGNYILNNGQFATIPGGGNNVAASFAFAAGYNAHATNSGAFVWSDGAGTFTSSTNNNSVTMRASGGYRFFTGSANTTYAFLAAGSGSWTSMSDRNAKENFQRINPLEILERVAVMPVDTWNYKTQPASIRHIGPTAQDFKAAFSVGETDTGISVVDEGGVALAAIQGLNEKMDASSQESESRIQNLETENAELKQRNDSLQKQLDELKETVKSLSNNGGAK